MKEKRATAPVLVIYCIILFAVWTVFEVVVKSKIDLIQNDWLTVIIKSGIVKNLVWTLPAILLILHFKNGQYISLKAMFTNHVNWLGFLPVFAVFTLYILAAGYITHGKITISPDFEFQSLIIVTFVGITEEMVFRGWLLNSTISNKSKRQTWSAVFINALLFLAIHFPRWIDEGIFAENFYNLGFLCLLALSVVFSQAFIRSKSILVPIALHMYWDLLMFLFV